MSRIEDITNALSTADDATLEAIEMMISLKEFQKDAARMAQFLTLAESVKGINLQRFWDDVTESISDYAFDNPDCVRFIWLVRLRDEAEEPSSSIDSPDFYKQHQTA